MGTGRFAGKVAVVTGGASGIGAAAAAAFCAQGARVVIADINDQGGELLAGQLRDEGGEALFVHTDATSGPDAEAMVEQAVSAFVGLHLAVNNTGNLAGGDFSGNTLHDTTEEQWDGTVGVSLRSTFLSLKYELLHMMHHGGGAIVNISSLAGIRYAEGGSPAYAAAKAGVAHLTEVAAVAYGKHGIRVNCVSPGLTATPAVKAALSPEQQTQIARDLHVIGRLVEPIEQAYAILWLCSEEAAMVTGHNIPVDGGWAAR